MAILTDTEAIDLLDSVEDQTRDRIWEEHDEFDQRVIAFQQRQLMEYEVNAAANKRVPYQQDPVLSLVNLQRHQSIKDGKEKILTGFMDTREDTFAVNYTAYMSTRFQLPVEEIENDFEFYADFLKTRHGVGSDDQAFQADMDETRGLMEIRQEALTHAFNAAVISDRLIDSYQSFTESQKPEEGEEEKEIPEGILDYYSEAFKEARIAYDANREEFDDITERFRAQIEDPETLGQVGYLNLVAELTKLDSQQRKLALTYANEKIGEKGTAIRGVKARAGNIRRFMSQFSPGTLITQARSILRATANGEDLSVTDFAVSSAVDPLAGSAIRVSSQTAGSTMAKLMPFWRIATPEEARQRTKDARRVGDFARAMQDIDDFINKSLIKPEDFESENLRWLKEKMLFPSARMAPDMLFFIAARSSGKRLGKRLDTIVGSKGGGLERMLGFTQGLRANVQGLKVEAFNKLTSRNPNIDSGIAYNMADVSGNIAAVFETMADSFVLSKLPGVGKLIGEWGKVAFKSGVVRFAATTSGVVAVETGTELMQDYSSDLVQAAFSSFDDSVPGINLGEAWGDVIKEAPDIALAILPYALLGGASAGIFKPGAADGYLSNPQAMEKLGISKEDAADIAATESTEEKLAKFRKVWNPKVGIDSIDAFIKQGGTVADMMPAKDLQALDNATAETGTRDEPVLQAIRNEDGEITEYKITLPDGTEERYTNITEARNRVEQWHNENGKAPEIEVEPVAVEKKDEPVKLKRPKDLSTDQAEEFTAKEKAVNEQIKLLNELGQVLPEGMRERLETGEKAAIDELKGLVATAEKVPEPPTARAVSDGTAATPVEHAERQGDDVETETDFSGKETISVSQKVDQAKETRPTLNAETVEINNAFLEEQLKRLGVGLPAKIKSTWKGLMLEVLQNANWFAQALDRVRALISADRVETIHIHDHPMLLLFNMQLIKNRNAQEVKLAQAISDGIESRIAEARSEIQGIQDLIEQTTRAMIKVGTPAGQILNQRQMTIDIQDTGSLETLRRSHRLRVGKEPNAADDAALTKIAKGLDKANKQKLKLLDKSAKKLTKVEVKNSKQGFDFIKTQVKKAKVAKDTKEKILAKIKKDAEKRNWCIGGKNV